MPFFFLLKNHLVTPSQYQLRSFSTKKEKTKLIYSLPLRQNLLFP
jgi:hypothetical protein